MSLADYPSALESTFAWIVQTSLTKRIWFEDYYDEADIVVSSDPIQIYDPVNPSNNVCKTYTTTHRSELVEAAANALDAVTAARYGTTKGYANECWQRVFGPTFRGA